MTKMRLATKHVEQRSLRGAVYVEFLIAFLPIFFFFLALVQFVFINIADMLVRHAAVKAARAAVVVIHDDDKFYDSSPGTLVGKRKRDVERAAHIPLSPMETNPSTVKVHTKAAYGRDEPVTVRVEYDYTCDVPGGRLLCCGLSSHKKLMAEATMQNQGAAYAYGH